MFPFFNLPRVAKLVQDPGHGMPRGQSNCKVEKQPQKVYLEPPQGARQVLSLETRVLLKWVVSLPEIHIPSGKKLGERTSLFADIRAVRKADVRP